MRVYANDLNKWYVKLVGNCASGAGFARSRVAFTFFRTPVSRRVVIRLRFSLGRSRACLLAAVRANLEGMDDQCDPSPFDEDTAKVLLRVLTARSVKRLLLQLQELDLVTAQWLNNYAAENSPMTGNEFIEKLFDVKGTVIPDQHQGVNHTIDPQNLAHRILTIRNDMAQKATMSLPEYTTRMDAEVMRRHLTKNTFVSGTTGEGNTVANSTKRRGYFRPRPPKK